MKKIFLFTLSILPLFCASELFLEITKGSEDPFKVAMIHFAGNASVSKKLNEVSWFQKKPLTSLSLIEISNINKDSETS